MWFISCQGSLNGIIVHGNRVWIRGKKVSDCPAPGRNVAVVKSRVYIDGYEFIATKNRWQKTLRAWLHTHL